MSVFFSVGMALEDNLILQLIQAFAKVQNLTSVTACLPIPRSARDPIPWGILTMNLTATWKNMWKGKVNKLPWVGLEGNYTLNFERNQETISKGNITKPAAPWAKEIIYQPSGDACTNIPWGCQIMKTWKQPQKGTWDHIQKMEWCVDFTGMPGSLKDPP